MNKIDWLSRLIAFDTTSRNSNLSLIKVIEDWFKEHHIKATLLHHPSKEKANLFATLPAEDGNVHGGILLSGHTDVVPVDDQKWATDPFVATQIGDEIFGRGTADMKGFIAVVLAIVPTLQQKKLKKPVHFAFSYDEEIGCLGAPLIVKHLNEIALKPDACIVGEPSMMRPIVANKGIQAYRYSFKGQSAHSSLTNQACNAIFYAAKLVSFIEQLAAEIRANGPFDNHFDVAYTTISPNIIHGGVANNIIPDKCELTFEFRQLPQTNPEEISDKIKAYAEQKILPKMQAEFKDAAIEIKKLAKVPSFAADSKSTIFKTACQILSAKEILKVAYATEAGLFQAANIPTIICGPGSIGDAHKANEFVAISQLDQCEEFLLELLPAYSA